MEALSNSIVVPSRFVESSTSRNSSISSLLKVPNFPCWFSRTHENFESLRVSWCESSGSRRWNRFRALTHEEGELGSGAGLIPDEGSAFFEVIFALFVIFI